MGLSLKRANLTHFFRFCCLERLFIISTLNTFGREFNHEHFVTLHTHTLQTGFISFKLYFTKESAFPQLAGHALITELQKYTKTRKTIGTDLI